MITSAQYTDGTNTQISVTFEGGRKTIVPVNANNALYAKMVADNVNILAPELADLLVEKANAKQRLNEIAEAKRQQYITPGDGKALAYQEIKEQALDVKTAVDADAAGLETQDVSTLTQSDVDTLTAKYPIIVAEIPYRGVSCDAVATIVLGQYEAFRQVEASIVATVNAAKAEIDAATTVEEVQAAYEAVTWSV